jgi:hypothetical protein
MIRSFGRRPIGMSMPDRRLNHWLGEKRGCDPISNAMAVFERWSCAIPAAVAIVRSCGA